MNKLILNLGLIFCLISCQSNETQEIVKNQFKITIPRYMTETATLNQEAVLQYQNEFRNMYLIVIEDKKKDMQTALAEYKPDEKFDSDFDKYSDFRLGDLNKDNKLKNKKINGLNAKNLNITDRTAGAPVHLNIALIEGKDIYYQVITWTSANKESQNKTDMEMMVDSFTEI